MEVPLILVTNDDGIDSDGLWAAVEALTPLGEVCVVAPDRQWSGGGRSMPPHVSGRYQAVQRTIDGMEIRAFAVDASPALAVQHAILEFVPRLPSLVVSGINFGANLATEVTISGTVGAALEAAAFGIPALAVSLEMDPGAHLTGSETADYAATKAVIQRFAWHQLIYGRPCDVDVLNINVPSDATPETPWRLTCLSRHRYYDPVAPDRASGVGRPGYKLIPNAGRIEIDSDVWAVKQDRIISVTPLSLDMTSRVNLDDTGFVMKGQVMYAQNALDLLVRIHESAAPVEAPYVMARSEEMAT
ncbi:MAG: 5'/3'-nucleotidase SurE [Anaerolineae bacterium]|jgi:5'-nucleotidase